MAKVLLPAPSGQRLNFKVVQYRTAPAETDTAAENTIAVVTDTPIFSWVMSAEQPDGVEGMVWIQTAVESTVQFYVDKKQLVEVHPIATKQFIGDTWVQRDAEIYQGGGWNTLSTALLYYYNNGVSVIDWTINSSASSWITFGETSIVNTRIGGDGTYLFFHSTNPINVTDLTSVNFRCDHAMNSGSGSASGYRYFGLSSTGGTSAAVQVNLKPTTDENGTGLTYSLDVSNLEGEYYIIYAYYKPGGGYNLGTVTIYEIYGVQ